MYRRNHGLLLLQLGITCLFVFASGLDEQMFDKTCSMKDGQSFSDLMRCVLNRHKRQAFDPYDRWGDPRAQPCHHYVTLYQPERRVGHVIDHLTDDALCDRALKRRWYRFQSEAGGMMPESCVDEFSCGTHAPIWLNGRHPRTEGEVLDMEVCVSLAGHCCNRRWRIRVANCGTFYTYQLVDTPGCFMAYCVGGELPCPAGTSSPTGFSPGCTRNFPQLTGDVTLEVDREGHQIIFYCDYVGRITRGSVINTEWFVTGDKSDRPDDPEAHPVWTDRMVERRRSKFVEGRWQGKMGSTVYCKMRPVWSNNTGVPGPAIESDKFFAGIVVDERVMMLDEASDEAVISLRSTVPITCLPQFRDACSLTLQVAHDQRYTTKQCVDHKVRQVVFGDCSIEITPATWRDTHQVKVKAVRDFYYDGNKKMSVNFKPAFSTTLSSIWNNYQVPNVQVIAKDAPTKMCYATGDPHIVTFDGHYYHVYLEGEFVLFKNTRLPIQINVRFERCGKDVTCNCAIAVKAADDVIVVDRCQRRKRNLAFGENFPDGWRSLHRHALEQGRDFTKGLQIYEYDGGKHFTVHLPTGAYVDFKIGEATKWIDIYLYGSSDDFMSSAGLCGTFDNDIDNDFTHRDMVTRSTPVKGEACGQSKDVCKFAESWRVDKKDSFFGPVVEVPLEDAQFTSEKQYCKCEEFGKSSTIVCNYHYDVDNCHAKQTQRTGRERTADLLTRSRSRRSAQLHDEDDDYFAADFEFDATFRGTEPEWPTPSGIIESSARRYCRTVIERSQAGAVCANRVTDLAVLTDQCMTDIKVTDDLTWALSALNSLTEDCTENVHREARLWEQPAYTQTDDVTPHNNHTATTTATPHATTYGQRLLLRICPGDCSRNGDCVDGKCSCYPAFTGDDCSIPKAAKPKIHHLSSGGLCDVTKKKCQYVRVYGTNFRNTSELTCHFRFLQLSDSAPAIPEQMTTTVPAFFDTFEEVLCRLPEVSKPEVLFTAFEVQVANRGDRVSEPAVFIVHDSRCRKCLVLGRNSTCATRTESCEVGGVCFGPGDHNPADCCQVCHPAVSRGDFQRAKVLDPPKISPTVSTYVITPAMAWRLRVSADDSCLTYLEVNNQPIITVQRESQDVVTLDLSKPAIGQYSADVIAKDDCGATSQMTYRVIVVSELPMTQHSNKAGSTECQGNKRPSLSVYPQETLKLQLVTSETLTLTLEGTDPEGRPLEYFLLTSAEPQGITLDRKGQLSVTAPRVPGDVSFYVVASDDCRNHAHLAVRMSVRPCHCQHGGTCVSQTGSPWSRRVYSCACAPGYTGRKCERGRRKG